MRQLKWTPDKTMLRGKFIGVISILEKKDLKLMT